MSKSKTKQKAPVLIEKEENDTMLAVRVTPLERKILKMMAAQDDTTIPNIIRGLIKKFILDDKNLKA